MSGRIFLANVGANASHRFAGPVFEDGAFEFLPIPEQPDLDGPHAVRYRDLVSFNTPGRGLTQYVPERLWDRAAHADPEFETFTYGDNCEWSPRAAGLRGIRSGDVLLFLARLERWGRAGRTGTYGFYLVGFLEIESVMKNVRERLSESEMARFGRNAHVRRGTQRRLPVGRLLGLWGLDPLTQVRAGGARGQGDRGGRVYVREGLAVAMGRRQDASAGHRVVYAELPVRDRPVPAGPRGAGGHALGVDRTPLRGSRAWAMRPPDGPAA